MKLLQKISKKNLVSISLLYTGINFFNKVFPFILLPILTRNLTMSDFGEYSLFKVTCSFVLPIVSINVSELIMKQYYNSKHIEIERYISNSILINVFLTCFLVLLAYIINITFLTKNILIICLLIGLFTSLNNIERNILRAENNIKLYSILVIGQTVLFFLIVLFFLYQKKINLNNLIYIELITYFVFGIISFLILNNKFRLRFKLDTILIKSIFQFCFPLAINSLLAYAFAISDRYIITNNLSTKDLAIYSASFQLISMIQVLAISFNLAWTPFIYKSLSNEISFVSILNKQKKVFVFFLLICFIFYFFVDLFYVYVVGEKYESGSKLLIWFILGVFFQFTYWLNSSILIYKKYNWYLTFCTAIVMIISISLNLLFLKKYGIIFSSQIYCLSWFILSILVYIKVKKELK